MKHKQCLIFLLAGALLVLPVTQHYAYAISWDDIKRNISSFFNQETLQKIIPGSIIALGLAGFYYYWTRQKNVESTEIRDGISLTQFQVYCQFNENPYGGGAASCGYHALLRGMQLVQAKSNEKSDEYLQNILNDPGIIQHYFGKKGIFFGKNGTWRQEVIQKRKNDIYNGDWLDKEEIQYLWNENKNKFIFEEELCDLNVVDDVSLIGQVGFDLTSPFILEKVQPNLNKNKLFFVIFALGTMRQAREGEAYTLSYGHWYPLVMYQDQTGKRYYYIMDSGSYDKVNRLKDENAWKIINLIEEAARSI